MEKNVEIPEKMRRNTPHFCKNGKPKKFTTELELLVFSKKDYYLYLLHYVDGNFVNSLSVNRISSKIFEEALCELAEKYLFIFVRQSIDYKQKYYTLIPKQFKA